MIRSPGTFLTDVLPSPQLDFGFHEDALAIARSLSCSLFQSIGLLSSCKIGVLFIPVEKVSNIDKSADDQDDRRNLQISRWDTWQPNVTAQSYSGHIEQWL